MPMELLRCETRSRVLAGRPPPLAPLTGRKANDCSLYGVRKTVSGWKADVAAPSAASASSSSFGGAARFLRRASRRFCRFFSSAASAALNSCSARSANWTPTTESPTPQRIRTT
tara:strand:+ start:2170 stop:2511 length:342 start_codon:yes stop_codon:yes gene_type:complete